MLLIHNLHRRVLAAAVGCVMDVGLSFCGFSLQQLNTYISHLALFFAFSRLTTTAWTGAPLKRSQKG